MRLVLAGGMVVDGTGSPSRDAITVIVDDGRIDWIGPAASAPEDATATTVDVQGMTIMPGLIDLHAHLCWAPNLLDPLAAARDDPYTPDSYLALWGARHARNLLEAGFTTVRDGFAYRGRSTSLALRDAIRDGAVVGPRIVPAGYAGMTGTEPDMRLSPLVPRPSSYAADGPWELRRLVRECARDGYEWVKTFTSGGRVPGGQEEDEWYVHHTPEEMHAIVDEAHRLGMGVMVHATTTDAIRLAVLAGADTIEHGWPLDDDLIDVMLKNGTVLVPTISVYSERGFLRDGVDAPLRNRAEHQFEARMSSFRRAYTSGLPIAVGTDALPSVPTMRVGESAFELQMMVRQGMSPMDAIVGATQLPAKVLGLDHLIGTVEVGKVADLLVVEGDPLVDITVLERQVRAVMKAGELVVGSLPATSGRHGPWAARQG